MSLLLNFFVKRLQNTNCLSHGSKYRISRLVHLLSDLMTHLLIFFVSGILSNIEIIDFVEQLLLGVLRIISVALEATLSLENGRFFNQATTPHNCYTPFDFILSSREM